MKIGINATILDDRPSGLGIFSINIIKELIEIIDNESDEIIIYTSAGEQFVNKNVEVRNISKFIQPRNGKLGGILRFLWNQFVFPIKTKKDNIDVVYVTTHHGSFFINSPQVITIHDLLPIIFPKQHKLQYYYFKYIVPKLLKKTKFLVTVSNNTLKDIVKNYGYKKDNIEVVYNSFDKNHFTPQKSSKFKDKIGNYFLFLGASYPHKNLENAILSFINIKQKYPDIKLVIAGGKREYRDFVINKLDRRGSDLTGIEIIDYVKYDDLPCLYSNAIALLYPTFYEGFGIPPLEAMASGCPVIVSNTSSLPEVCNNAAYYINPGSVSDISSALEEFILNKELRAGLIEKGFENIKRFSWKKSSQNLYYCLKKVLKE
ncbi:glycosyltransferase family 1 protein [Heyndrickxia coagulans]|uniref:glycosyltransferase family 4 protein n=1 Tax=Heyndrickxia coagulans TaxID=1398 RepID=UPI002E1FFBF0|nr:glycosyltransferase family 1 protein [Heyndrickxia coagulans]